MAMNDEETVALIAGGHTFGKTHGAGPASNVGPEPEAAPIEAMGLGWLSSWKSGKGVDAITSGLEGAWTSTPTRWDMGYFHVLFKYEWELVKSPAGAWIWHPIGLEEQDMAPEVDGSGKKVPIMMSTADMAHEARPDLRPDLPALHGESGRVRRRLRPRLVQADPSRHGPEGALSRPGGAGRGPDLAGPGAGGRSQADRRRRTSRPSRRRSSPRASSISQLVSTAWASASTFRGSDKRGGANGARIRLAPQKDWAVNQPAQLAKVLATLEGIQAKFNKKAGGGKKVSLADLIVLGGAAAIEQAAKKAGAQGDRALHAGSDGRHGGADRRRVLRRARAARRTASATTKGPSLRSRRRSFSSTRRNC